MSWATGRTYLCLRLGERQFEAFAAGRALLFFRAQGWCQRLRALRLVLLRFD